MLVFIYMYELLILSKYFEFVIINSCLFHFKFKLGISSPCNFDNQCQSNICYQDALACLGAVGDTCRSFKLACASNNCNTNTDKCEAATGTSGVGGKDCIHFNVHPYYSIFDQ